MENKYFKSTSFYLCAFLLAKGLELTTIEPTADHRRCQFVFKDTSYRETLVQQFNYASPNTPELMIDARAYMLSIKTLKEKLYQDTYQP